MEKEQKKFNKLLIIIIALLVVIIIALVALLLMSNKDKKKTDAPSSNNSNISESNSNKEENDPNEGENDSNSNVNVTTTATKETEELMKLIPNQDNISYNVEGVHIKVLPSLYVGKPLTVKDINIKVLMYIASQAIPFSEQYSGSEDCSKGSIKLNLNTGYDGICFRKNEEGSGIYAIPEDVMKKYLKKYYGNELQYKQVSSFGAACINYKYQNGYYFTPGGGCGGVYTKQKAYQTQFLKEETKNDEKYIYLSFVYYVTNADVDNSTQLYKDSSLKEKIASNVSNEDDIFEVAGDKAAVYKHTYKKNADGSYYWYSVDRVK